MNDAEVRRLAEVFRNAIEFETPLAHDVVFECFPAGSCGDAALLLGRFLREHGAGTVEYVLGRRRSGDDRAFHAWLLVDGLTIDITADQFDDIAEPVIVTTTSPWHGRVFEIEDDDLPGDYRDYDDHTVLRLNGLYAILMRNLRFSHGASPS